MYYHEFREELLQMMKDQAEAGFKLELVERQKLNGQLRYALMIQGEGIVCAPVIYLEEVYEEFCHGRPLDEIAGKLWLIYQEEMKDDIQYLYDHISCMLTFDAAASGLYVRIMNYEKKTGTCCGMYPSGAFWILR
ncbi:MAG: DUF5688 family protein [Lachnospiraceae bacterium]|nr:DUF5688 family protein [Lachnospiraceae bacterium]